MNAELPDKPFLSSLHSAEKSGILSYEMRPAVAARLDPADVLRKATLAAAERLELSGRDLADIIGTSEASISRLRAGRGIDPGSSV